MYHPYKERLIPDNYVNPYLAEYREATLEARINQLERQSLVQAQELTRLNQEIMRINQELNRMNQVNVAQTRRINRLNERLKTVEMRISLPVNYDEEGF